MFKIIKARLKAATEEWQQYLVGKELLLYTTIRSYWALVGIEGEEDLTDFCKSVWEKEEEHEYESLNGFIADVNMGNCGFDFSVEEIEIIEEAACIDVDKYLKSAREEI